MSAYGRIHFKVTLLVKGTGPWCGAALVMTTSLIKVVRQTLTGQCYIDIILEPIVYPHFRAHQAARPTFQDDNAVHIWHVLLQILLHKRGLKNFSGRAGVPI